MEIKLYDTSNVGTVMESIPANHMEMFMKNPFLYDKAPVQLRAENDNKVLGSVYAFPMEIAKGRHVYMACAGSSLTVELESRGMGLAKKMTLKRTEITTDKVAIASGLSSMSLPLFKKLGFCIFLSQRYIFLQNSQSVLRMYIREGILLKLFSTFANLFLGIWKWILAKQRDCRFKNYFIEEAGIVPQEVVDIAIGDSKLWRENHTKEWFEWVMDSSFAEDKRSKQHLFVIKKNAEIVGFYMTKERFHAQASRRGFENIILGSVIEWGVKCGAEINEEDVILHSLLSFGKHVDAIEVCSAYDSINSFLRKRMLVQVGNGNFAIKANELSPLYDCSELKEQKYWRIRPAASDNSFD